MNLTWQHSLWHICACFAIFLLLFINYGYLELMISRVHISAYQDWWMRPRCWSHAEGLFMHRTCAVTQYVFLQRTYRHSWQQKCSWQRKFQERLLSPPSLHEKDILRLTWVYVLLTGYCLLPCAIFQCFLLFSPPKESLISHYNTELTFIACFSL